MVKVKGLNLKNWTIKTPTCWSPQPNLQHPPPSQTYLNNNRFPMLVVGINAAM